MTQMTAFSVVTVTLEDRADGGLRVFSEDLPGLILSGPDKTEVCSAIAPAIKALLEFGGTMVKAVEPSQPIREVIRQALPRDLDMHVKHETAYVVILANHAKTVSQFALA
jgi:hypothetical protein